MANIRKNTNKARTRKRKIKARVQAIRSGSRRYQEKTSYYSRSSENERFQMRSELENFVRSAGSSLGVTQDEIEKEIFIIRYNMLFNEKRVLDRLGID